MFLWNYSIGVRLNSVIKLNPAKMEGFFTELNCYLVTHSSRLYYDAASSAMETG